MIIHTSNNPRFLKSFASIIGVIILFTFIKGVTVSDFPSLSVAYPSTNYEQIGANVINEIISTVELKTAEELSSQLYYHFKIRPIICELQIDADNLNVTHAKIVFSSTDILISTYEIKSFIKEKYEIDAEVFFG